MKLEPSYTIHSSKRSLVVCLAALFTLTATAGWAADDAKKLQDENAALRKRLAEVEGRTGAAPSNTATAATDEGVTVLSPYKVNEDKDYGYLKTNAVTATRIGMEIQKVPLFVSVMSSEFLQDASINSLNDIFRYSASAYGDNAFRMARPANSATPQGGMTMRGFPMNTFLQDGVFRYTSYNLDNTERVEIVKGPAAVFFGQGYPGGVINYITKKPVFGNIPTTITLTGGSDHKHKVVFDHNAYFSKKAAMRIVGSWENSGGTQRWEYIKNNNATINVTLVPFDSGKVRLTTQVEILEQKYNYNNDYWRFPEGWFNEYKAPTAAMIAAAGLSANANPVAAYQSRIFGVNGQGTWMADKRIVDNDATEPLYYKGLIQRGATITNASGARIQDKAFNYKSRGTYTKDDVATVVETVELSPFKWMDFRYVLTHDNNRFNNVEGQNYPLADGRRWNSQVSIASSGYYRRADDHQFDVVLKFEAFGIKSKVLFGGISRKVFQNFNGNQANGSGTILTSAYNLSNFGAPPSPTIVSTNTPSFNVVNSTYTPANIVAAPATSNYAPAVGTVGTPGYVAQVGYPATAGLSVTPSPTGIGYSFVKPDGTRVSGASAFTGYPAGTATFNPNGSIAGTTNPTTGVVTSGTPTGIIQVAQIGWATALFPFYGLVPGASNSLGNPNFMLVPQAMVNNNSPRIEQVIRDRNGVVKNVQQVYTEFDPGYEIAPDVTKIVLFDRNALDGYKTQDQSGYINYQASLLNDRLNIIAGVRREEHRDNSQDQVSIFPWFSFSSYAWTNPTAPFQGPQAQGYDLGYIDDLAGNFGRVAGTSWMGGAAYDIRKDLTAYVSVSKVFKMNSGSNQGGYSIIDIPSMVADALAYAALSTGNDGAAKTPTNYFTYRGVQVHNAAEFSAVLHTVGADKLFQHEKGINKEIGLKSSLFDGKITGTLSIFSAYRQNQRLDDGLAQAAEPFNSASNLNAANASNVYFSPTSRFYGQRLFRWRTIGIKNSVEGTEGEVIWTPVRNFQSMINASYLWTAKTNDNPTIPHPGSTAYNALSTTTFAGIQARTNDDLYYGQRVEHTPKIRFNTFSKYTFTNGPLQGLQVGLGTRYTSEAVISRSVDWNPTRGGAVGGNYLVFDSTITYPWEVFGYKISTSANVQNLSDKLYFEGGPIPSAGRQLFLINTLKF